MRVSNHWQNQRMMQRMMKGQSQLDSDQNTVATSNRYESPKDNPQAATESLRLESEIEKLEQYNTNISFAKKDIEQIDRVLQQSVNIISEIRDLSLQAINGFSS